MVYITQELCVGYALIIGLTFPTLHVLYYKATDVFWFQIHGG